MLWLGYMKADRPALPGPSCEQLIFSTKNPALRLGVGGEPYGAESTVIRRLAANRIVQDCTKIVTLQVFAVSGKYTEIGWLWKSEAGSEPYNARLWKVFIKSEAGSEPYSARLFKVF